MSWNQFEGNHRHWSSVLLITNVFRTRIKVSLHLLSFAPLQTPDSICSLRNSEAKHDLLDQSNKNHHWQNSEQSSILLYLLILGTTHLKAMKGFICVYWFSLKLLEYWAFLELTFISLQWHSACSGIPSGVISLTTAYNTRCANMTNSKQTA